MKTLPIYILFVVMALSPIDSFCRNKLVEVAPGYSQTSVNTTIFRNSSVVSWGRWQYVAYYDSESFLTIGKRCRGSKKWTIKRSQYQGNCKDAHNVISLMVDGDGYLHLAFDHHGHPLNYCRSIAPGSLELGAKESMVGDDEGNVTYPEFYRMKNGDLIFAYRSGASGRGNLVMNRYNVATKKWARIHDVLIDGESQRNAYWQICVDAEGTIHVSWVWRETWLVETNHDICYARSKDGGVSWEKSNGEKYTLPITAANAEYAWRIPQNSELINQTSMTADKNGYPYIATYWRDYDSKIPQYRLVYFDGASWQQQQVSKRITPFSLSGGGTKMIPIARPRLVIENEKDKCRAFYLFRDEERGSKVSMAYSGDLSSNLWTISDLTDFSVEAWEPSIDTELWKDSQKLHVFVQKTGQGDGERTSSMTPQMVYILEVDKR